MKKRLVFDTVVLLFLIGVIYVGSILIGNEIDVESQKSYMKGFQAALEVTGSFDKVEINEQNTNKVELTLDDMTFEAGMIRPRKDRDNFYPYMEIIFPDNEVKIEKAMSVVESCMGKDVKDKVVELLNEKSNSLLKETYKDNEIEYRRKFERVRIKISKIKK